jgi:Flp pilus assembly protein TadD
VRLNPLQTPIRNLLIILFMLVSGCTSVQDIMHTKLNLSPSASKSDPPMVSADAMHDDADRKLTAYKYAEAETAYQAILAKNPDDNGARLGLAESRLGTHELDSARTDFIALSGVKGYEARALQGVGLAEMRKGNVGTAITAFNNALSHDPTLWRAWNGLAQASDLSKNWQASATAYAQALKYAPDGSLVHNNMGVSLLAQARYDEALKEFEGVLKSNPNLATARTNRQIALALLQRYPDALDAVPPGDKARALNNIGYVAMLKGDYDNAEKFFSEAVQENPENKAAQENLELVHKMKENAAKPKDNDSKN